MAAAAVDEAEESDEVGGEVAAVLRVIADGGDNVFARDDALRTLGQLLHDHPTSSPLPSSPLLLSTLLPLLSPTTHTHTLLLALHAAGTLCLRGGGGHTHTHNNHINIGDEMLPTLVTLLANQQKKGVGQDRGHARLCVALMRATHAALAEVRSLDQTQVSTLIRALRPFFLYGLSPTTPSSDVSTPKSTSSSSSSYTPPHRRSISSSSPSISSSFSSDGSDISDTASDTQSRSGDISSRVRAGAMQCVQAMCVCAGGDVGRSMLHAQWAYLFPAGDSVEEVVGGGEEKARRREPNLVTGMMYDPSAKVRVAAATAIALALEGRPTRAFLLSAADWDGRPTLASPFVGLSGLLGRIIVQLHVALARACCVSAEASASVRALAARALAQLISASPYDRLPGATLSRTVITLIECLQGGKGRGFAGDTAGYTAGVSSPYIACVGAALGAQAAETHIKDEIPTLVAMLFDIAESPISPLTCKADALQSLQVAAARHVEHLWPKCFNRVLAISESCVVLNCNRSKGDDRDELDRLALAAVKLLGELLRVIGGVTTTPDIADGSDTTPDRHAIPINDNADITHAWQQALDSVLMQSARHEALQVRAAALMAMSSISPLIYASLPRMHKDNLVTQSLSSTRDSTAIVKASALRLVGSLARAEIMLGCSSCVDTDVSSLLDVLTSVGSMEAISVRVAAISALADACEAISRGIDIGFTVDISALACCVLISAKEGDKVRAHALRALGYLARCADIGWVDDAVAVMMEVMSISSGANAKSQWNACHAVAQLLGNPKVDIEHTAWAPALFSNLLTLVESSPNYKIRIHAALALATPTSCASYGPAYIDIVAGLARALSMSVAGEATPSLVEYKHKPNLESQLRASLAHILSLCHVGDIDVAARVKAHIEQSQLAFIFEQVSLLASSSNGGHLRDIRDSGLETLHNLTISESLIQRTQD